MAAADLAAALPAEIAKAVADPTRPKDDVAADAIRDPGDDHTLSIFDKAIQGKTDQYAFRFIKPRAQ